MKKQEEIIGMLRCFLAELLGTFALTFVDAGGSVISTLYPEQVSPEARALATGLLVMAMIFSLGNVSGAHINPAVTFSFALRRVFPWREVPLYWTAQIGGAVLAALLLLATFGPVKDMGANKPHFDLFSSLIMESTLSCLLILVILSTSTRLKVVGPNAAIPVGATVALAALFARPISEAVMNPARALGPALVSGKMDQVWIYIIGPLAGGAVAVFLTWLVHGRQNPAEIQAAQGDKHERQ